MPGNVAYLVFDIETIADGRLVQRVRFPEQPGLSPAEAVKTYRAQLLEQTDGRSDFVPHTFQVPVSVAVAKVGSDFQLQDVVTLDRPRFRPHVIARQFWKGWLAYGQPTFVTFNGRFFDLPVMELCCLRYGIPVPEWFKLDGPSYTQPRNRYNQHAHIDVQDVLTNFGANHLNGGLNLCAQLLGKPGKMGTKGDMVQDLWEQGEHQRIDDYCICDALDTYFLFLRVQVLLGKLDLEREHDRVRSAKTWIEGAANQNPALAEYLAHFREWHPPGDESSPFVE